MNRRAVDTANIVHVPLDWPFYADHIFTIAGGVALLAVAAYAVGIDPSPGVYSHRQVSHYTSAAACGFFAFFLVAFTIVKIAPSELDTAATAVAGYAEANDIDVTLPAGVDCDLTRWTCLEVATIEGHTLSHRVDVSGDPHIVLYRTGAER